MDLKEYIIDAKGERLGRVATEAAAYLMGKNRTDFVKNRRPNVRVRVINAGSLDISEKKRVQKEYPRFTGYPGGLSYERLEEVIDQKGHAEVIRHAIYGMLPGNKLRGPAMKRIQITE